MKRTMMTIVTAVSLATGLLGHGQIAHAGTFPAESCRNFFGQQGPRLCMTALRGPQFFKHAELDCQDIKGRLSDYNDWSYRRFRGDAISPPKDTWLGPRTANGRALFANGSDIGNLFAEVSSETSTFDSKFYTCSHDDVKD